MFLLPQGSVNAHGSPPHIGAKISFSFDGKSKEIFKVIDVNYSIIVTGDVSSDIYHTQYRAIVSLVPSKASFLTRLLAAHREWWHNPVFPVI